MCLRLLELGNVKAEDPSNLWGLSDDMKSMFPENNERSPDPSVNEQFSETSAPASQTPRVDSSGVLSRSYSVDPLDAVPRAPAQINSETLLSENIVTKRRRASDSDVILEKDLKPQGERPTLLMRHSDIRAECVNLSTIEKTAVCAAERRVTHKTSHVTTTCSRSALAEESILVAKALAASACVDAGVHNRTDRLKVQWQNTRFRCCCCCCCCVSYCPFLQEHTNKLIATSAAFLTEI